MSYQRTINRCLESLVESGDLTQAEKELLSNPSVEETMRYRHPTLDHLSLHDFTTEVLIAAYDLLGIDWEDFSPSFKRIARTI